MLGGVEVGEVMDGEGVEGVLDGEGMGEESDSGDEESGGGMLDGREERVVDGEDMGGLSDGERMSDVRGRMLDSEGGMSDGEGKMSDGEGKMSDGEGWMVADGGERECGWSTGWSGRRGAACEGSEVDNRRGIEGTGVQKVMLC
jgi:hypothetical protein